MTLYKSALSAWSSPKLEQTYDKTKLLKLEVHSRLTEMSA